MADAETTESDQKETKSGKEPKAKQQRLPGMTPPQIRKLQDKADEVKEHEQDRLDAQGLETKARAELLEIMKELKIKHYRLSDELEVVIEASEEKAFVRKVKTRKPRKVKAE